MEAPPQLRKEDDDDGLCRLCTSARLGRRFGACGHAACVACTQRILDSAKATVRAARDVRRAARKGV